MSRSQKEVTERNNEKSKMLTPLGLASLISMVTLLLLISLFIEGARSSNRDHKMLDPIESNIDTSQVKAPAHLS